MTIVWLALSSLLFGTPSGQGVFGDLFSSEPSSESSSESDEGSDPFDFFSFFGSSANEEEGNSKQDSSFVLPNDISTSEIGFPQPAEVFVVRPVLVNIGPSVDVDFGRDGLPDPFDMLFGMRGRASPFEESIEQEFQNVFKMMEMQSLGSQSGGFHVENQDGWFRLRASLPGYKMQRVGEAEGKQPLTVQVLGHSLLVQGRQTDETMTRSFQRSFHLPCSANADAIEVTYNVTDGALAVDIPTTSMGHSSMDANADTGESWSVHTLNGGSQTSIMFSQTMQQFGNVDQTAPSPQASHKPTKFLDPQPQKPDSSESFDPIGDLVSAFFGESTAKKPEHKTQASSKDQGMPDAPPRSKQTALPSASSSIQTPMVVQPKDAKPFWRLITGEEGNVKEIEVVLPDGIEAGTPDGQNVPVFRVLNEKVPTRQSLGQVELPVSVDSNNCQMIDNSEQRTERILSCRIEGEVKHTHVPIRVVGGEL